MPKFIFILISFCALSLRAETITSDVGHGFYVSNASLAIHDGANLAVHGSLILSCANVQGSGTLTVNSSTDQTVLHATQSTVTNLSVLNTDTLKVYGQLTVLNSLTIDHSILDARAADLTLSIGACVFVYAGKLLADKLHEPLSVVPQHHLSQRVPQLLRSPISNSLKQQNDITLLSWHTLLLETRTGYHLSLYQPPEINA